MPVLDPIIILTANYCVALLFLLACCGKLSAFSAFRATLEEYELLPKVVNTLAAAAIVVLEASIVVAACLPASANVAMLAAAVLLTIYASAIGVNLLRGRRDIDCGCTGPARRQLLSGWLVLRNLSLVGLALIGACVANHRVLQSADFALVGIALLGAMSLYAAINQLMVNAPRLDALDAIMDAG